jgi:serine protease Do
MLTLIRRIFLTMILLTISLRVNGSTSKHLPIEKSWEEICSISKNAVFQIFSSVVEYDLNEPYKSPERCIGCGTGFCIDPLGLVVTNYHVIANAISIFAQLPALGKEKFELTLVGTCPSKDVALLRFTDDSIIKICKQLNVKNLPYLVLGDSDNLHEAQELMTLGYPLGLENLKCSLGHNSGREIFFGFECIQTTASTNPGNSGGPFFNDHGNVIGIHKGSYSDAKGMAYLIPISTLIVILEELKNSPLIRLPEWGAEVNSTNNELLNLLACPHDGGVYVYNVKNKSVAEKAGIKKGDIIFALNNKAIDYDGFITSLNDSGKTFFTEIIYRQPMKTKTVLSICRNGTTLDIPITLYPADRLAIDYIYPCIDQLPECEVIGGLVITEICMQHIDHIKKYATNYGDFTTALAACKYDKFENRQQGRVGVTSIIPYSEAFRSNCFNNAPITFLKKINGQEVFTINDVRQAILSGCEQPNLIIEADDGKLMVLSVQKIIAETPQLIQHYGIPLSPFIENLAQQLNHQLQGKEA